MKPSSLSSGSQFFPTRKLPFHTMKRIERCTAEAIASAQKGQQRAQALALGVAFGLSGRLRWGVNKVVRTTLLAPTFSQSRQPPLVKGAARLEDQLNDAA